jgi:uncharacterized membrane protein YoaK (UPF0700 family)
MLVHEGDSRTSSIDLLLAVVLSFVAGGSNSAGYFAFGYFSANMTGNVSMVSDHISAWQVNLAFGFLEIVLMFILGAFVASLAIAFGKQRRISNIYALTLLLEVGLLMAAGLVTGLSDAKANGIAIVGLLSLTMGIQNAASTRISDGRVRTTHLSGLTTDIGVNLALLIGHSGALEKAILKRRLKLHIATVVAFLLGGIVGVFGYKLGGGLVFCFFSLVLLSMCARYLWQHNGNSDART